MRARIRHASQAARMLALYLALLVPAVALYPSLHASAVGARERQIESEFGPEATRQREDLQRQLGQALDDIDSLPNMESFLRRPSSGDAAPTDQAFLVWSRTPLKDTRQTSAVELYAADGTLVSRFAFNLPEYTSTVHFAASCRWEVFDEVSPFGSSERHVLRASRGICSGDRRLGAVVVRVMLDYRTLRFISSENPYLESMKSDRKDLQDAAAGREVEFVVYGPGRCPTPCFSEPSHRGRRSGRRWCATTKRSASTT
jgi:hypothetical protein